MYISTYPYWGLLPFVRNDVRIDVNIRPLNAEKEIDKSAPRWTIIAEKSDEKEQS